MTTYPRYAFKFALVSQDVNLKDGTGFTRYNVRNEINGDYLIPDWTTEKTNAVELVEHLVHYGLDSNARFLLAQINH